MIALEGLSVKLGGVLIIDDVEGEVARGEWVTLIGPNGAGKSTLLRALAGLVPYTGSAQVGGDEVAGLGRRELARRLAFVPQTPLLPPAMRVSEYVLLGRTPHLGAFGYEGLHDREAAQHALDRLDLEVLKQQATSRVSPVIQRATGQRRSTSAASSRSWSSSRRCASRAR